MDNQKLFTLLAESPLTPEEQEHWKRIIPILTEDQKQQLEHILSTKIEVTHAIDLIQKSLDIISEAEAEAEYESGADEATANEPTTAPQTPPQDELHKQIEEKTGHQSPFTEEKLVQMHTETKQRLEQLRQELGSLSTQATQQ